MAVDPRTLKVGDQIRDLFGSKEITGIFNDFVTFDNDSFADTVGSNEYWNAAVLISSAGDGHPRFLALLDQLRAMHLAKSADYGTADDIFANFHGSTAMGIPPWQGAVLRLTDKVFRIQSFIKNGTLKNEPLMDSFLDLASYALIAAVLFEEAKDGTK